MMERALFRHRARRLWHSRQDVLLPGAAWLRPVAAMPGRNGSARVAVPRTFAGSSPPCPDTSMPPTMMRSTGTSSWQARQGSRWATPRLASTSPALIPIRESSGLTISSIEGDASGKKLKVRLPGWAVNKPVESDLYAYLNPSTSPVVIKVGGIDADYTVEDGYAILQKDWQEGDEVSLSLPMDIHQVVANERLTSNEGLCAYERGPLVYCAEGIDNGGRLDNIFIPQGATGTALAAPSQMSSLFRGGMQQLRMNGMTCTTGSDAKSKVVRLIPYFARAHRAATDMKVSGKK